MVIGTGADLGQGGRGLGVDVDHEVGAHPQTNMNRYALVSEQNRSAELGLLYLLKIPKPAREIAKQVLSGLARRIQGRVFAIGWLKCAVPPGDTLTLE